MDITSSPNAYERYQLVNFWKLMEKTEKMQNHVKKMIFGQTYMKLAVAMEMPKMMEMHLTHQNFCDR